MFSCQTFATPILILLGLTAATHINATSTGTPPPQDSAIGTPRPDPDVMHCALTQYIPWVRAQGRPIDPDLKAKKLEEIDAACGSPLHLLSNITTAYDILPGSPQELTQPAARVASIPPAPAPEGIGFEQLITGPPADLQAYVSKRGVDINQRNRHLETLLDVAADHNNAGAAKLLLDHGASIESSPPSNTLYHGNTALFHAAYTNSFDVAKLLIVRGAKVDSRADPSDSHEATPLCAAASEGHAQMVKALLKAGAQVDAEVGVHQTPLSEALAHGHMDVVHVLMDHGAKLKSQYLAAAAVQGRVEATKLLLTQPMDQVTKDDALRFAILGGPEHSPERIQIVQDLLDHGANIDNLKSVPDVIPVMFATTPDMVEFLFAHGANKQAKLTGAQIAQGLLCNNSSKELVKMLQVLISRGIDIGGTTSQGSALGCAKRANDSALMAFLEQHHLGVSQTSSSAPTTVSTVSVAQPANLTITQNGKVTNVTMTGQLASKNPVGCVPLRSVDNTLTPPDLYFGVSACILKEDYGAAAALFALAGVESRFDAARVLDKSAGQAGQVLIMNTFNGVPQDKRDKFGKMVGELAADQNAMTATCAAIRKIGYPNYYPEYMVLHGIHAFTAKPGDATMEPNFDAQTTWNSLLTSYLNCNNALIPTPMAPPSR